LKKINLIYLKKIMIYKKLEPFFLQCEFLHKQIIDGEIIISLCCNDNNLNKNEGNCNKKNCPIKKEEIEKMSLIDIVTDNPDGGAPIILIHSLEGLGKSSWAANSPNPIFLQTEKSLTTIIVDHFPLAKTTEEVWKYITMLITEDHQYKTLVVDTLDWLEKLFWTSVVNDYNRNESKNIEHPGDIGYQHGYAKAMVYHEKFIKGLMKLHDEKNMAIILICHNEIKNFSINGESFDKFTLKLHKKAAAKYKELAYAILFLNHRMTVTTSENVMEKNKAVGQGQRVIYTDVRPMFEAKSRYDLPFEINCPKGFGFNDILKLINK
ncbi:MAG TPA: ATP-binding protein, partial [Candidatus Paceibacterota bacterium]|nr:ATP-binding protein [Candidatus Paceibacterota bacterium]